MQQGTRTPSSITSRLSKKQANATSPPTTLPVDKDKADRIAKILNSALKEEMKAKNPKKDSSADVEGRVKELESRLTTCKKEYKKYKEECTLLRAERESYIEEVSGDKLLQFSVMYAINDDIMSALLYCA